MALSFCSMIQSSPCSSLFILPTENLAVGVIFFCRFVQLPEVFLIAVEPFSPPPPESSPETLAPMPGEI